MQDSSDDIEYSCTAETEFVEFNKFDYIILFQALDPIRKTSREFLLNQISAADAFKRIKNQYDFYACTMKKNLSSNRKSKQSMETMFGVLIFSISVMYTGWVMFQIFRILRGRKQASISLIYAIISVLLVNPAFSVLTIVFDILSYRSTFRIDADKKQVIDDVEKAIEDALKCKNPDEFTKQKVCKYYRYFEQSDDNPDSKLLCECGVGESCESNSELKMDKLANKMVKMDNINQFFENQKRFVLKKHNPYTKVKHSDSIDRVISFCLGKDTVRTIRYHMSSNTLADKLISENATTIRNNAPKLLSDIESFNYKEIGHVDSYEQYFIVELNQLFFDLSKNVLMFLSYDNNQLNYVYSNPKVTSSRFTGDNYSRLLFRCNNHVQGEEYSETNTPIDKAPTKDVILDLMLNIQTRLKRLNKLWLPEYEALHRFLYKDTNVSYSVQRALYRSHNRDDMRPMFHDIVAVVLNNQYLHLANSVYVAEMSRNTMTHCFTSPGEGYLPKSFVYPVKINITTFYGENFATQDTMMMSKMESFIRMLSTQKLGKNFMNSYKMETLIVQNITNNEVGEMLADHPVKVKEYILYNVNEKQRYFGDDEKRGILFINNMNTLIDYVSSKNVQAQKNSELFFNAKNEIESPHLYMVYPEFELKLDNIDKHEFDKYVSLVNSVTNDMEYITDHTELLNNNLERQHHMASIYSNFIIIYFFVSLLILFDISFRAIFKTSFDEYITAKLFKQTIETPLEQQSDSAKTKLKDKTSSMLKNVKDMATDNVNKLKNLGKSVGNPLEDAKAAANTAKIVANATGLGFKDAANLAKMASNMMGKK